MKRTFNLLLFGVVAYVLLCYQYHREIYSVFKAEQPITNHIEGSAEHKSGIVLVMVLILDGNSLNAAHAWWKIGLFG